MFKSYVAQSIRRESSLVSDRLFKVVITPRKLQELEEIPDDLPRVTPQPNPPLFGIKDGYQSVAPYTKLTYTNVNRLKKKKPMTVMKLFETSFLGKNMDFYKKQIMDEQLWILRPTKDPLSSGKKKLRDADYSDYETLKGSDLFELQLKENDVVVNHACIHELKVPDSPNLNIIYEDKSLLVVNKPAGIPVHPSGSSYKFNTLQYLLTVKMNPLFDPHDLIDKDTLEFRTSLWPCHRLDKDTSGVLIFAKNQNRCSELTKQIENKKGMTKRYLALVHGKFGPKMRIVKDPVVDVDLAKRYENGGIGRKILYGKTTFKMIHYDEKSDTSLLDCHLFTGRRHQIRQHLRNLGFHIVHDPLYGIEGILKERMFHYPEKAEFLKLRKKYELQLQNRVNFWEKESICSNCYHVTYNDPTNHLDKYMRLHSIEYTYQPKDSTEPVWKFKTPLPHWAEAILPANKAAEFILPGSENENASHS